MATVTTIGLDIAKQGFQVHGADKVGKAVLRRSEVACFFTKLSYAFGQAHSPVCLKRVLK